MISRVANTIVAMSGGAATSSVTTAAIDTTGAVLIECTVASFFETAVVALTDSKGNTWILNTTRIFSSIYRIQKFYCYCSEVGKNGSGHTFTFTSTAGVVGSLAVLMVQAYAADGALTFFSESAGAGGSTPLAIGNQTPPATQSALITAGLCNISTTHAGLAISLGLGILNSLPYNAGNNMGGASADLIQATGAALNPVWSLTTPSNVVVCGACYLENQYRVQSTPNIGLNISHSAQEYKLTGLNSNIAQAPAGFYVQQLPMFRLVKLKKADGTWANVFTVFGVLMKMPDGTWEIVGEF